MPKTALLIDADLLIFRSCAVAETRTVEVTHIRTGETRVFKTRTEFKNLLKSKGKKLIPGRYTFTDVQTPKPLANALHTIKTQLNKWKTKFDPDVMKVLIGGKDNFRESLPLPKKYKGNRKDMLIPIHREDAKKYLIERHQAEVIDGCETDDALIYYGYEYLRQGYDVIICTIDKDSLAYSGLRVYDFREDDNTQVLIPDFGHLEVIEKGKDKEVKGVGFVWYCQQMLLGDGTDHYRPFEVKGVEFGELSAYKVLKDTKTHKEALEAVIQRYKTVYPEPFTFVDWTGKEQTFNYLDFLKLYHKCVRMKETKEDDLDFVKFCQKYEVNP
jgi:hypothetical protein